MRFSFKRVAEDRGWPNYLFGGRMRTSTAGLIVVFVALFWVNQNYQPEPQAPAVDPAQQVVPPGFVPDPNYTWVPRTNVQTRVPEYTTTTPPTTTTTTTTTTPPPTTTPTTTSPSETTTEGPPGPLIPFGPSTTVIDPDGFGPQPPQTFTQAPAAPTPTTVAPPDEAPTPTPPAP
ncbi:hypothetical protein MPRF_53700 [Mycolicibacterium parafortuitum]|uniref:Proline rich protein n=1 Tax=Mycolicibacterium parafortuitum TaxID=39692 RepID=A0A7I7UC63_MYCPF|nr:hypothetical protein CYL16_15855 [Mycobacterium sp. EPG1]BBY78471.1 hypothetical protein MPRF_53700 [Mycolicibacterium parafortuitum]